MKNQQSKLNVLMIDYSEQIGKRIKDVLSSNSKVNFLGQAKKLAEGILLSAELNPDVLFLEIKLAEGNVREVFQFLKKTNPFLKIVIFSFFENEFYKNKCKEMGGDYFIDKAEDFDQIPQLINAMVSSPRNRYPQPP